jgi:hypothetical protein
LLQEQRKRKTGREAHEHHDRVEQRALRTARRHRFDGPLDLLEFHRLRALVRLVEMRACSERSSSSSYCLRFTS